MKFGRGKNPKSQANLKKFQPGESGNPGGRPKKRLLDEIYEEILLESDSAAGEKIVRAVLKKAQKGDMRAAQLVNERTQGKAKQPHEVSGPNGGPIPIQVISKIPRPQRDNAAAESR